MLKAVQSGAQILASLLYETLTNTVRAVHRYGVSWSAPVDNASAGGAGNVHDSGDGRAVDTAGGVSAKRNRAATA